MKKEESKSKQCPTLFSKISQPPSKLKNAWKGMIPEWAWNAMVDDTVKVLTQTKTVDLNEDIERRIRNRHVFIKREAFFPEAFLPDVVKDACQIIKKKEQKKD